MPDLRQNTDASLLFGPVVWSDGLSLITNTFSLCCNIAAVDLFTGTTKVDLTIQSGGTNDVVFNAAGYCTIQLVASQVSGVVGPGRLSYEYTGTLPGWEDLTILPAEAYDFKYGSTASNIANIKLGTTSAAISLASLLTNVARFETSTAIGVASTLANVKLFGTSAAIGIASTLANIGVLSASVMRDVTSIAIGVNSTLAQIGIMSASVMRDVTSTVVRLTTFNASTAIGIASLLVNVSRFETSAAVGIASTLANVKLFGTSAMIGIASTLAQIGVFSASAMRDITSLVVAVGATGTADSIASSIWGHTTATSAIVAIKSALSNTISIDLGVKSAPSATWDVVRASHTTVGTFGEVGTVASMASEVWGHNIAASMIVAIKSTLSNAIYNTTLDPLANAVPGAYGVGTAGRVIGQVYVDTSSLLSNVVHLEVQVESTMSTVNHLHVQLESTWSNVNAVATDVDALLLYAESMPRAIWEEPLSQHSTVGMAGAYLYAAGGGASPADVALAVWQYTVSQESTIGMAGAYLMTAGASADPLLNAVPGAYGVGTAGRVLGQIFVDTTSILSNVNAVRVSTASLLSNVANVDSDLAVAQGNITTILAGTTSIAINVSSALSNIANVDSDLATVDGNVTTILAGTTSIAINVSSLLSNVANVDADLVLAAADITTVLGGTTSIAISVSSLLSNVANVDADVAALNNISAADVNAQMLDVLNVDTFAEPGQEAPGATVSLVKKIGYLYKNWRNRKTATSTAIAIYNDDAATVDQKATQSDDGVSYDKGEIGTGP
ncbi:MAG: hypothetical protein PHD37_17310 [Gallionellaceae bacterium]|nr:hypothetical protein [Gallionellaceae bacterium]